MRIVWLTDIHLNFLDKFSLDRFVEKILKSTPDALFITGDIGEGTNVADYLLFLAAKIQKPIYFVLGNHDFYHSSIAEVRRWAEEITGREKIQLVWMSCAGVVQLSETTAVVGVDGWGDAQFGNPETSQVFLNDWLLIKELKYDNPHNEQKWRQKRNPQLRALGREEGERLREPLLQALAGGYEKVYVLTHVPPWDTATWHMGAHSEPDWQPWFACKAVGEVIEECAKKYPSTNVVVLCGHTHGEGYCERGDNVVCFTGGAQYHYPKIQKVFEIA